MFRHALGIAFLVVISAAVGCAPPALEDADGSSDALSSPPSRESDAPGSGAAEEAKRLRDAYLASDQADFVRTGTPKDSQGNELLEFVPGLANINWASNFEYFVWRGKRGPTGGQIYAVQSRNYPSSSFARGLPEGTLTVLSFIHLKSPRNLRGVMTTGSTQQTVFYADVETVAYAVWPTREANAAPRFFYLEGSRRVELAPAERTTSARTP